MPAARTRWAVLAAVLAVLGVLGLVLGLGPGPPQRDLPGPRPVAAAGLPQRVLAARATVRPAALPTRPVAVRPLTRSVLPVHLAIPAIGVSHDLLRLGLNADRTVEVPPHSESEFPGWYRLGPTPGRLGSAVVLGHVDSMQGPAVFYRLRLLEAGDRVDVRLQDGTVAHFAVRRVTTYANAAFPAQLVYGPHGYAGLNLVTCGGAYDAARGGYQSNVVVFTRLVGTTPA